MLTAMSMPVTDSGESAHPRVQGVVVGFDGSTAADFALDWGAQAAVAHGLPLTILTARPDAEADVIALPDGEGADIVEPDMAEMAREAPDSLDALAGISGVGAKKLEAYGEELLRVLGEVPT